MTITEWRHRRYRAMRLMLGRRMPKEDALEMLELIWPLDEDVVCDCGQEPPKAYPLSWFNWHGANCKAVRAA